MEGIPSSLEDLAGRQVLSVLLALLPGLIASEIIYSLTVREKKEMADRVILGLIHTFIIYITWQILVSINGFYVATGWLVLLGKRGVPWTPNASASLIGLGFCAVLWGLVVVWVINTNHLHAILYKCKLTISSSRPNQWYEAFYLTRGKRHVTVNFKDGRRIFGWAFLWPNSPKDGHIFLTNAEWLDVDNPGINRPRLDVLIDVADIGFIEFVPLLDPPRKEDGQRTQAASGSADYRCPNPGREVQLGGPGREVQLGGESPGAGGSEAMPPASTAQANNNSSEI